MISFGSSRITDKSQYGTSFGLVKTELMTKSIFIFFLAVMSICAAYAQQPAPASIDGAWFGTLSPGQIKLRLVFHISSTEQGLTASLDSIDQNAKGIPVTAVTRAGDSLKMELNGIHGVFEGKIDYELATISGTWTQGGATFPLSLKRVKDLAEILPKRPQEPAKPYPYREEDVTYENASAGITLAATLTLPSGKGPFPAVLLITGSGPQDRNESIMGHRPFLVLADYLTRRGIAVLRADDRGIGKSGGKFFTATTADFATDAEAGVAYLKSRPEINRNKIGLVGHSEGAIIAPMLAARNKDVAFIVMLAGSGVPGDEVIAEQNARIAQASGLSHEQAQAMAAQYREALTLVKAEKDNAVVEKKLREKFTGQMPEPQLNSQIKSVTSPWFRYFISYDPAIALSAVTCPVLALSGSKDLQVPPDQNLPAIRKALEAAGNGHFEIDDIPGLNHLFQTATTGAPAEYGQIEETMAPAALKKIGDWLATQ